MSRSKVISAPFTHGIDSVPRTMLLVMLALLPATAFSLYQFGWPAIILFVIILVSSLFFEAMSLLIARKPVTPFLLDGSAVLTGWLGSNGAAALGPMVDWRARRFYRHCFWQAYLWGAWAKYFQPGHGGAHCTADFLPVGNDFFHAAAAFVRRAKPQLRASHRHYFHGGHQY